MARIGIMTTQDALNNGAMLQAFALQTYLQSIGHEVEFIDFRREKKQTVRSFIAKNPKVMWYKWMDMINEARYRRMGDFGDLIQRGDTSYYSLRELQQDPPKYDVYIAGSDQIWNVSSRNTVNRVFYLDFGAPATKRISYAASMGQCNVPQSMDKEIYDLVKPFDFVSLREIKAANYIQGLFKEEKQVHQVPDPTFLLSKESYLPFILSDDEKWSKEYIASYILVPARFDQSLRDVVELVASEKELDLINLRNPDTCVRLANAQNIIVTPKEWLQYVYYSKFMICCSFHAVVFSLILHKPFIVVTPYKNERIISLLSAVGLMDRIVMNFDKEIVKNIINTTIDWEMVDKALEQERAKGVQFLNLSLN
ncbi:polysaccharide pyruvyl transferase family protein [Pseudozobellia sp. WGM2]|uniref:polysaccharide pyruvyl transferase family protein n=1 Tax=Pseudozobellia sp. WGM2 TaxID=2787625 RepID=UPI001ADF62B6|nr:polysaccharide pyruvyl transferase family protein [Pseudozobellia sp. WGM2]